MKIKCPFCKRESDSDRDLREHLVLDHEVSQAMIYFTKLLFKIHQKIQVLTSGPVGNLTAGEQVILREELKSLLDTKK